jgi:hypothetical protein
MATTNKTRDPSKGTRVLKCSPSRTRAYGMLINSQVLHGGNCWIKSLVGVVAGLAANL